MGDDPEDETFETSDAGSSHTYPMEAGQVRKGGFIMIKNNPCKVSDVSTSKTGKHGHAKCHFVAIDIFTVRRSDSLQCCALCHTAVRATSLADPSCALPSSNRVRRWKISCRRATRLRFRL